LYLKVEVLVGIPGSGKSTYCQKLMTKEPGKWKRINNDSLRAAFDFSVYSQENEKIIRETRNYLLRDFLLKGYNVLIDNLNINKTHFKEVCKTVSSLNIDAKVYEKHFWVELEEAISRDAKREGSAKVGATVIKKWYKELNGSLSSRSFLFAKPKEMIFSKRIVPIVQDTKLPRAVMVDLDGTLADISDRHNIYDASDCLKTDKLNVPVANLVSLFYHNNTEVIFCSGREDKFEASTRAFIDHHLPGIKYQLFMRKTKDMRPDDAIKEEIFMEHIHNKYYVVAVIDDRLSVCRLWNKLNLPLFRFGNVDANF